MKTSDKLAQVLDEHGLSAMAKRAREGYYDDYRSPIATPIRELVQDLQAAGQHELANRAANGEFDGTKEEAEEWRKNWERGV